MADGLYCRGRYSGDKGATEGLCKIGLAGCQGFGLW